MKPTSTSAVSKPTGFMCKISEKIRSKKTKYKLITFGLLKLVEKIKHKKRSG
jgi:hypothetical protein